MLPDEDSASLKELTEPVGVQSFLHASVSTWKLSATAYFKMHVQRQSLKGLVASAAAAAFSQADFEATGSKRKYRLDRTEIEGHFTAASEDTVDATVLQHTLNSATRHPISSSPQSCVSSFMCADTLLASQHIS